MKPEQEGTLSAFSGKDCFFCGRENPIGPKLVFEPVPEGDGLVCRWRPGPEFRGLGQVLHGGIVAGMVDEIMGQTAHQVLESPGVTRHMEVEYLAPLYVGEELTASCRLVGREGRRASMSVEVRDHTGKLCTTGQGQYVMMSKEAFLDLVGL